MTPINERHEEEHEERKFNHNHHNRYNNKNTRTQQEQQGRKKIVVENCIKRATSQIAQASQGGIQALDDAMQLFLQAAARFLTFLFGAFSVP